MNKYISKAEEIHSHIQNILNDFKIEKGCSGWPDSHVAPQDVTEQFQNLVIDTQLLLFSDSPNHPLYAKVMELHNIKYGSYYNFVELQYIISKYIEYRKFLEAKD